MKTTKGNVPRRVNSDSIIQSAAKLITKVRNNEITNKQADSANSIISGMNRIAELESKMLKMSTPDLLEKIEQEVKKTTARIKLFKEASPDVHIEVFEEWLKNNQVE